MTTMTNKEKQVTEAFIEKIEKEILLEIVSFQADTFELSKENLTDMLFEQAGDLCKQYENLCEDVVKGYGVTKALKLLLEYNAGCNNLTDDEDSKNIYVILSKYILIELFNDSFGGDWQNYHIEFCKKYNIKYQKK